MAFSRQSHIFYNNSQNNDEEYRSVDEPDFRPNTMLEDQYTKFKKRNHYLRKSVVMVDSDYRDTNDKVISQPLTYKRFGMIFSSTYKGIVIIYHPNHSLSKGDRILFNSIAFYPGQKMINNLSTSKFIFNTTAAEPIFNIYPISNIDIFKYISWDSLSTIVSNEYYTEQKLLASDLPNFYYFNYVLPVSLTDISDCAMVDSNGNIKLNIVTSKTLGYYTTSYFKINFSKTLFNIYKLKLLDIKLPDKIFNVNNIPFTTNGYKYRQNGKIRFLLENNNFIVSNVDYVGYRIKYDFYNPDPSESYNIYLASDIYSILTEVLSKMKSMPEFIQLSQQYMFEIAYYFYTQYVLYYNKTGSKLETFSLEDLKDPTTNNSLYYVYTLDLINNALSNKKSPFILKPYDALNNKMPLVYFNDYILYVNNDTYAIGTIVMNWFDMIIVPQNPSNKNQFPLAFISMNNIKTKIGIIQNTQEYSPKALSLNIKGSKLFENSIQYKIGFSLLTPSFNPKDYSNIPIYTILSTNSSNFTIKIIENTSIAYCGICGIENQYFYLDVSYSPTNHIEFISNMFKCGYTIYRGITESIVATNNTFERNKKITYRIGITLDDDTDPGSYVGVEIYGSKSIANLVESYDGFDSSNIYYYTVSYDITETAKYMYGMILPDDKITTDSVIENQIGTVYYTYEPIGQVKDVRFSVIVESVIQTGNPPITLPIDRIQIDKTINAANQDIINYKVEPNNILTLMRENTIISTTQTTNILVSSTAFEYVINSPIVFSGDVFGGVVAGKTYYIFEVIDNTSFTITDTPDGQNQFPLSSTSGNMLCTISFPLTILDQPKMDDTSKLFIFNVSLTTNHLTIPDIYVSQNYNAYHNSQQIGICYSFYYNPIYNSMIIEKYNTFQIEHLNDGTYYIYSEKGRYNFSTLTPPIYTNTIISISTNTLFSASVFSFVVNSLVIFTDNVIGDIDIGKIYYILEISNDNMSFTISDSIGGEPVELCECDMTGNMTYSIVHPRPNRNYIYYKPIKTNMQNLETYALYPEYEVTIPNGDYNDTEFAKALETALNSAKIMKYNYLKKDLEVPSMINEKINNPEYSESRFKVSYDEIVKGINISSYSVDNKLRYVSIYNPIYPYMYIKLQNANIDNNQRVYIDVLNNNAQSNITNNLIPLLNKEVTARILPVFQYQLRILYPLPSSSYIGTMNPELLQSYTDFASLLSKIRLDPYNFTITQPNLSSSMRNLGQMLLNQYKNSNSYIPDSGKIINNFGIQSPMIDDELCIVINNIYYTYEVYKFGRITQSLDKTSNSQGNYRVNIQLCGDTRVSHPLWIGDIVYFLQSKTIAMIVPYEWGMFMDYPAIAKIHTGIPSSDIIEMGYKNYLKLLYKYTGKRFLIDYMTKYNMMSYTEYNMMNQNYIFGYNPGTTYNSKYFIPMFNWPIQEIKNCFAGFEIPLNFPVSFTITEKDISLQFLTQNKFCLFLGPNQQGISDTPINILGFDSINVFTLSDYKNNSIQIPWKSKFNNMREVDNTNIQQMYLTYSSDNVMRSNMILSVDNVENFSIGDKVYIRDLTIDTVNQRNIFNIYNTDVSSINNIMSFEMYLNYIVYRLALIQLGIPIPNGPTDFLRFDGASIEMMTSATDSLYGTSEQIMAFSNFIIETHGATMNSNNLDASQMNVTDNIQSPLSSNNVCAVVANIINKVVLNKIIPWFIQPANILSWTKGDRRLYIEIYNKYIDLTGQTIFRIECQVINRFVFAENIDIFDQTGSKIGTVLATSIIPDSSLNNGDRYTIYVNTFGLNTSNIITDSFLLTIDKKYASLVATTPFYIIESNKHIYLYDTYLRYKTILQLNAINEYTTQKVLNFNQLDGIENIFSNLFNIENQNINGIKNGYYVSIAPNQVLNSNEDQLNGFYRVMTSLLDYKNLLMLCNTELGLLTDISNIQNDIIDKKLGFKNIDQIKQILDIYQLLTDLLPSSTVMIDLNWSAKIERNILQTVQYSVRQMDMLINICGSRNYILENFIYNDTYVNLKTNITALLNKIYSGVFSDKIISDAIINNDIVSLCKYSEFQEKIVDATALFARQTDMLYCVQWLSSSINDPTTTEFYVILPDYLNVVNTFNRNNLVNYIVYVNWTFIDNKQPIDLNNIEYNARTQSNIITKCEPVLDSKYGDSKIIPVYTKNPITGEITCDSIKNPYYIWKLTFKFPFKYPILRGSPILIKDYYTTLYKEPNQSIQGKTNIYIEKNWIDDNQMKLDINYVIKINYGSYNPIYKSYINNGNSNNHCIIPYELDDTIHEETNIIKSISNTNIINPKDISKKYIHIELIHPLKYEFASGLPAIIMTQPANIASVFIPDEQHPDIPPYEVIDNSMYNVNSIACNCLSTQNIIINGEWYTKIYYQGDEFMDIYGISPEGLKVYPRETSRSVSITNMKGHVIPNIGFQELERCYYNSSLVGIEADQNNTYIKPVPNGIYKLESFIKEDNINFMEHVLYDLPVQGRYEPMYAASSPEQSDEWNDNQLNCRWIYCTASMDITTKSSYIDLFVYTLEPQPTVYNTTMDYLGTFIYAESTTYMYNTQPVYKVYMKTNVTNNASHFMNNALSSYNRVTNTDMNLVLTDKNITFQITPIYYLQNASIFDSQSKKNITYNFVVIKGRYQGYGGSICYDNTNDIINNIEYTVKSINTNESTITLDLDNNPDIYISFYRFFNKGIGDTIDNVYFPNYNNTPIKTTQNNPAFAGSIMTPFQYNINYAILNNDLRYDGLNTDINVLQNEYSVYGTKYGPLAFNGILYKKTINQIFSTQTLDYIYICFKNIDTNIVVELANSIGSNIIFAKLYINKKLNNYDLDITNYEIIYDFKLLPDLNSLEVFFLDKDGYLINFNKLNVNLQMEVHEYVERIRSINTHNGQVM